MKITNLLAGSLLFLSMSAVGAETTHHSNTNHFTFHYNSGDVYDVQFGNHTITWTSLAGANTGQSETDKTEVSNLSKDVEVIQWIEKDGTFVTVIFDRLHMRIVSSGKTLTDTWLANGFAEEINN